MDTETLAKRDLTTYEEIEHALNYCKGLRIAHANSNDAPFSRTIGAIEGCLERLKTKQLSWQNVVKELCAENDTLKEQILSQTKNKDNKLA